ncbi:MAG: class B sortase [Oscillospiraceae bacterium]|nr:class B sortase [Oscillospiraceae bacterium]
MFNFKKITASAVLITALLSSAVMTGCNEKTETTSSTQAADELAPTEAVTEAVQEGWPDIETFSAEPCGMSGRARSLQTINDEVIGYISIPETYVDYPVTQCGDNEGYMHTDLYGGYLDSGTIFMDYRDFFMPDESKQSNNLVLYGHNMLNGTKFASLHDYRQDDSLYGKSPIIEFSSNYVDNKYVIFAYFLTSGSYGDSAYGEEFAYWDMQNMNEKEFKEYVDTCRERSYISPDIDVEYGDQIITLQTCHMDEDNSRFIVIGRKLRDGEKPEDFIGKVSASDSSEDEEEEKDEEQQEEQEDSEEEAEE